MVFGLQLWLALTLRAAALLATVVLVQAAVRAVVRGLRAARLSSRRGRVSHVASSPG